MPLTRNSCIHTRATSGVAHIHADSQLQARTHTHSHRPHVTQFRVSVSEIVAKSGRGWQGRRSNSLTSYQWRGRRRLTLRSAAWTVEKGKMGERRKKGAKPHIRITMFLIYTQHKWHRRIRARLSKWVGECVCVYAFGVGGRCVWRQTITACAAHQQQ